MKLVSLGIDPDHRPIAPVRTDSRCGIAIQLANGGVILLTILLRDSRKETPGIVLLIQHGKWNWRRLGSIPIILDLFPTTLSLSYSIYNVLLIFYYVVLETEPQAFFI